MQFGWNDYDALSSVRSNDFARFLDGALTRFPDGAVSTVYAPFANECTYVGRIEEISEELIRALTLAGERFDASAIRSSAVVSVPIDESLREHAKAPRALLEKVMQAERATCGRWGYNSIPEDMIGTSLPVENRFCCISATANPLQSAGLLSRSGTSVEREPMTPFLVEDAGRRRIASWGSGDYYRTATLLKQHVLDALDFTGSRVVCMMPVDWVIPLYILERGAQHVSVVTDRHVGVLRKCAEALTEGRMTVLQSTNGLEPGAADVALYLGGIETLRHPFYFLQGLGRLVGVGGRVVVETGVLDLMNDLPLLYCPRPKYAPFDDHAATYFNMAGLKEMLAVAGFPDAEACYEFYHALPDRGSPYSAAIAKLAPGAHESDSAFGRCALVATRADDVALNADLTRGSPIQLLQRLWTAEIDSFRAERSVERDDQQHLVDAIRSQAEQIDSLRKSEEHWRVSYGDRDRELLKTIEQRELLAQDLGERTKELQDYREELARRTAELNVARAELVERTRALERAAADLVERTQDLVTTRQALVDRTIALEALAAQSVPAPSDPAREKREPD